jgi:hypothetical protein
MSLCSHIKAATELNIIPDKNQKSIQEWKKLACRIYDSILLEKISFFKAVLDVVSLHFIKKRVLKYRLQYLIRKIEDRIDLFPKPLSDPPPITYPWYRIDQTMLPSLKRIKEACLRCIPSWLCRKSSAVEPIETTVPTALPQQHQLYLKKCIEDFYTTVEPDPWGGDLVRAGKLYTFLFSAGKGLPREMDLLDACKFILEEKTLSEKTVKGLKKFGSCSWGSINKALSLAYKEKHAPYVAVFLDSLREFCPKAKHWNTDYFLTMLKARDTQAIAKHIFPELAVVQVQNEPVPLQVANT